VKSPPAPLDLRQPGAILLISCYELGHQPLGIAWPRAFLERASYTPEVLDLAVDPFDETKVRRARFAGIAVPMHTALRLGVRAAERIRGLNRDCFVCFYGLYALLNAEYLLEHVADAVIGGEFESALVDLVERLTRDGTHEVGAAQRPTAALSRPTYLVPDRRALPDLRRYVHLARSDGSKTPAGYVEASRGCLHHCLHCPIPPIYGGRFFAVPRDVVLEDIRRLVAAGAGHVTFGDPDFLNGPGHALKLVRALHAEFPTVTYDFTAKIEHILKHRALFSEFAALGCVFVVSAVESLSDVVLAHLEKGHTGADVAVALDIVRRVGIALRPSFVAFTPWTTLADYQHLLDFVEAQQWIDEVDPVQYAIRLLVPPGSSLIPQPAMRLHLGALDPATFTYQWTHPDTRMDRLHREVRGLVEAAVQCGEGPSVTFEQIRGAAVSVAGAAALHARSPGRSLPLLTRSPRLTESWFCCAEPTESQLDSVDEDAGRWV
jgi:radical SAM superfamily enzyme YgiQ (UPF0313 family)